MCNETKDKIIIALYYDFINLPEHKLFTIGVITEKFYIKYPEFK